MGHRKQWTLINKVIFHRVQVNNLYPDILEYYSGAMNTPAAYILVFCMPQYKELQLLKLIIMGIY